MLLTSMPKYISTNVFCFAHTHCIPLPLYLYFRLITTYLLPLKKAFYHEKPEFLQVCTKDTHLGCIHQLNTRKYCDNTRKYCGNMYSWILSQYLKNLFNIASKLTCIVTILASITLAGEHIFQVLAQYSKVLAQYLWELSQYLRVLSCRIHPSIQVRP